MGCRVRRVAFFHVRDETRNVDLRLQRVIHGASVTNGGQFDVADRSDGYPPNVG